MCSTGAPSSFSNSTHWSVGATGACTQSPPVSSSLMTVIRTLAVTLLNPSPCGCSKSQMEFFSSSVRMVLRLKKGPKGKGNLTLRGRSGKGISSRKEKKFYSGSRSLSFSALPFSSGGSGDDRRRARRSTSSSIAPAAAAYEPPLRRRRRRERLPHRARGGKNAAVPSAQEREEERERERATKSELFVALLLGRSSLFSSRPRRRRIAI